MDLIRQKELLAKVKPALDRASIELRRRTAVLKKIQGLHAAEFDRGYKRMVNNGDT